MHGGSQSLYALEYNLLVRIKSELKVKIINNINNNKEITGDGI